MSKANKSQSKAKEKTKVDSSLSKSFVLLFKRPHEYAMVIGSKWRAFSKSCILVHRFHRIHVDNSRIRKQKSCVDLQRRGLGASSFKNYLGKAPRRS